MGQTKPIEVTGPRGTLNTERWAEVLHAAAEVFVEKGYEAATIQAIAARAGLSNKGSLYYYIESKEDLLWGLIQRTHEMSRQRLEILEEQSDLDPREGVRQFISAWIANMVDNEPHNAVIEREFRSLSAERFAEQASIVRRYEDLLRSLIERGAASGLFAPDLNVPIVVQAVTSMLISSYKWRLGAMTSKKYETIGDELTEFVLRGLGATPKRSPRARRVAAQAQ